MRDLRGAGCLRELATCCIGKSDLKIMIFFFEKCFEVARAQQGRQRLPRTQGFDKALGYQESHAAIAQVVYEHEDDGELRGHSSRELGKVDVDLAVQYESSQHFQDAIDYYQRPGTTTASARLLTTCHKTANVEGEDNTCAERRPPRTGSSRTSSTRF